jgi:hypothetical protein
MRTQAHELGVLAVVASFAACGPGQAPSAPPWVDGHHELHLPPVAPSVHVTWNGNGNGNGSDVVLATIPHEGDTAPLIDVWKAAFPSEESTPLHFDLVGSGGFHPGSRPNARGYSRAPKSPLLTSRWPATTYRSTTP